MTIWLGGPAGAGKTTVARLLARRCGLRWYSTDLMTLPHDAEARRAGVPFPADGGPATYDRGPLIRSDLNRLSPGVQVIVEGAIVTPELADDPLGALWLLPSPEEQLRRLHQRDPIYANEAGGVEGHRQIIHRLSEVPTAAVLVVDGLTAEETVDVVQAHFATPIADGETARTSEQRSAIARWHNEMILRPLQMRREATEQPMKGSRLFDCECGAATCTQFVSLAGDAAEHLLQSTSAAITANGHQGGGA